MNLFIKDDSSLMRIEDEMCSRNVTDRVVHTVDRCRRVPWITRPSFTISSLWRTTKWNPRISWKDLSLSHSCVLRSLEEPTAGLFIDSSLHDVAHAMPEDWHYVQVGTRDLNAASASARIRVNVYPFTYDRTKHYHREANKPSRACICKTVF